MIIKRVKNILLTLLLGIVPWIILRTFVNKEIFDEDFLMFGATFCTFIILREIVFPLLNKDE